MSISIQRASDEIVTMSSKWDIGASGAHTKVSGVPGTGFASVSRTAAGKYTITFSRGAPVGGLLDVQITHWPAANAEPRVCMPTKATYTAETASAGATVAYEAWKLTTPAQVELASGDQVTITATFLKTK
jgi:hypothetical protein